VLQFLLLQFLRLTFSIKHIATKQGEKLIRLCAMRNYSMIGMLAKVESLFEC
jgi:hypothetical protein